MRFDLVYLPYDNLDALLYMVARHSLHNCILHMLSIMRQPSFLPFVASLVILSSLLEPVVATTNANGSVVRTYYVGAVEEDWDYVPT